MSTYGKCALPFKTLCVMTAQTVSPERMCWDAPVPITSVSSAVPKTTPCATCVLSTRTVQIIESRHVLTARRAWRDQSWLMRVDARAVFFSRWWTTRENVPHAQADTVSTDINTRVRHFLMQIRTLCFRTVCVSTTTSRTTPYNRSRVSRACPMPVCAEEAWKQHAWQTKSLNPSRRTASAKTGSPPQVSCCLRLRPALHMRPTWCTFQQMPVHVLPITA